jgi:hypothetical protein
LPSGRVSFAKSRRRLAEAPAARLRLTARNGGN